MGRHVAALDRLILLTHPLAYHQFAGQSWAQPWIERERQQVERWLAAARVLGPRDVLAMVSCYPQGPADMEALAHRLTGVLGKRCVVLREPEYRHPDFWRSLSAGLKGDLLDDLAAACTRQGDQWNKEEMETLFHSRRCAQSLAATLRGMGLRVDPAVTKLIAWGEEFEGCTAKYALAFREAFGLARPAEIDYDLCVPGAAFLLKAPPPERIRLPGAFDVYIFPARRPFALFMDTANTLRDPARRVRVPGDWRGAVVRSKPGLRMWPTPATERRRLGPPGVHERTQPLVTATRAALSLPVCTGVIYRLAKAPAFLFAPPAMSLRTFRRRLLKARLG